MKSAAVLTVDEAFAFLIFFVSISAVKGMAALKINVPAPGNLPSNYAHAMPGGSPGWGGGMSGGVGSPKID